MIKCLNTSKDNTCVKIYEGNYEISIACEQYRADIRVFDVPNDVDVTHMFKRTLGVKSTELVPYTNDALIKIMKKLKSMK